jgi:hypothetical protein
MQRLAGLALGACLTGCAWLGPIRTAAETAPPCPAMTRAEAWINRMPGPDKPGETLIVLVEYDAADLWTLQPADQMAEGAALTLALLPGGAGFPGSAGYRARPPAPAGRIDIVCNGAPYHRITDITSAH